MKQLKCSGCGSRVFAPEGEGSFACEYCKAVTILPTQRVHDFEKLTAEIERLSLAVKKGDGFGEKYAKAKKLILNGDYMTANEVINDILDADPKQARAWFYMSLLPIYKFSEQMQSIDLAIKHSPEGGEIRKFYEDEKKILERKGRRIKREKFLANIIIIVGIGVLAVGGTFALLWFLL